jgi:hypothetical protein
MKNEKKQTAVEWYAIEMYEYFRSMFGSGIINTDILEKAKEMEKEQIEDAYSLSRCEWNKIISSSEYYNETYGGNDQ